MSVAYHDLMASVEQSKQASLKIGIALARNLVLRSESMEGKRESVASNLVLEWESKLKPFEDAKLFVVEPDGQILARSGPESGQDSLVWHFRTRHTGSQAYLRSHLGQDYLVTRAFSNKSRFYIFVYFSENSLSWNRTAASFPRLLILALLAGLCLPWVLNFLSPRAEQKRVDELRGLARSLQLRSEQQSAELARDLHDDLQCSEACARKADSGGVGLQARTGENDCHR